LNRTTPVPPSSAFLTNPLEVSEQRLEKLAKEGTVDACTQLTMVAQALREALGEHERQGKDGRNVVVRQFRQRLARVNSLIAQCQMTTSCSSQESFSDQQIPAFFQQNGDNEKSHREVITRRGT
jgi:hypothetical protein